MTIIELDTTHSTNTFAAKMNPQPDMPYIVRAGFQEQGRGQGDHTWESEPNKNLLFSVVFEPKSIQIDKSFYVSKFIALCLLELIQKHETSAIIKWPNDILVKEKKIAGILIENTIYGTSIKRCIAGIGLNINQEMTHNELNAVSLKDATGKEYDNTVLLNDFADIFKRNFSLLQEGHLEVLKRNYFNNLYKYNQIALYKDKNGQFEARIIDVQDAGPIVLKKLSGEIESYSFGEIEYLFSK